jgi:hypothetical protein
VILYLPGGTLIIASDAELFGRGLRIIRAGALSFSLPSRLSQKIFGLEFKIPHALTIKATERNCHSFLRRFGHPASLTLSRTGLYSAARNRAA